MAGSKRKAAKKKSVAKRSAPATKKAPAKTKRAAGKTAPAKAAKRAPAKKAVPATKTAKRAPGKKSAPAKVARKKTSARKVAPAKKAARKRATLGTTRRRRESSRPVDDEAPTVEIERASQTDELAPVSSAIPTARPSERVLAAVAETPEERALTEEEEDAMTKVAETARRVLEASGDPSAIVGTIATFLEDVRLGKRDEPKSQDVRLGLGVLWGEQLRSQVGWTWVHLTYPDGFASYALVPQDRAFACFPLNRVPEALRGGGTNTSAHVFESIREGALPTRKEGAYLVIG